MTGIKEQALDAAIEKAEAIQEQAEVLADVSELAAEGARERLEQAEEIAGAAVAAAAQTQLGAQLQAFQEGQAEKWRENAQVHSELRAKLIVLETELSKLQTPPQPPMPPRPAPPAPPAEPVTGAVNPASAGGRRGSPGQPQAEASNPPSQQPPRKRKRARFF